MMKYLMLSLIALSLSACNKFAVNNINHPQVQEISNPANLIPQKEEIAQKIQYNGGELSLPSGPQDGIENRLDVQGKFYILQEDGNFVLYSLAGTALWNSGSFKNCNITPCEARFEDGNLELLQAGTVYWSTSTGSHPGSTLTFSSTMPFLSILDSTKASLFAGGAAVVNSINSRYSVPFSGLCLQLDAYGAMIQSNCNNQPNQLFTIVDHEYYYSLKFGLNSDECITYDENNRHVTSEPCVQEDTMQQWTSVMPGYLQYKLYNPAADICLEIESGSTAPNAYLVGVNCSSSSSQTFYRF